MYEISKYEFQKWLNSLNVKKLSKYEITLINIISENYDMLASCGTAWGVRSKKIGRLIAQKRPFHWDFHLKYLFQSLFSRLKIKTISSIVYKSQLVRTICKYTEGIYDNLQKEEQIIKVGICPRCGGELKEREFI